ncbi:hypothetical protein NDU88_003580 [Pleurodeles waltl]|uniref:Uncharacterized protein n=1 Tax=Pleurodeles waltl TaxID=8319 RepID=A0AAV7QC54_PLEWA|nr:hypothetical protein NDU88_003580 [Pleurodeles waltl]
MSELTPKFNKWYDMKEEIEAGSDERLRVKARIMAKQESNKRYADIVNRAKTKNIAQGDWVLVKKPNRVMKGESVFQTPVRVQGVTRGAVCLEGVGWRSKDDIVRLKAGQEEIIMKGGRVDEAECTDDVDEWQSHEARDVGIDEEECANTPSRRGRIGHGSAERCEKAWRGLMDVEGQNGCRPESAESDSHNVMGSGRDDACAVRANSLQGDVVRELTYETGRDRIGPSTMFGRLTTSRPIRIEDGRDGLVWGMLRQAPRRITVLTVLRSPWVLKHLPERPEVELKALEAFCDPLNLEGESAPSPEQVNGTKSRPRSEPQLQGTGESCTQ